MGAQLQLGPRIVIMGDSETPYSFVSASNVADLAIAVRGNPAAASTSIPLSAQAVSFGQLVRWIDELTERTITLETVSPGTELPGLPPVVIELWTMFARGPIEPIETVEVAVRFGLVLETAKAFVDRTFAHPSLTP